MAWVVLVEQSMGQWWQTTEASAGFRDREEARAEALRLTEAYAPRHPKKERARFAHRLSPDSYVVTLDGAMERFYFRLLVAEQVVPGSGAGVDTGAAGDPGEGPPFFAFFNR